MGPDVHDLLVTLTVGNDTVAVLLGDLFDLLVSLGDDLGFLLGNEHVNDPDGDARAHGFHKSKGLELVENDDSFLFARHLGATPDDVADLLLADGLVVETDLIRPDLVETHAARGSLDDLQIALTIRGLLAEVGVADADPRMVVDFPRRDRELDLRGVLEQREVLLLFTIHLGAYARPCEVVGAENNILRRNRDRASGCGRENVVRREHELAALHLSLDRERYVDGHLVTVEVRVVGGANERMDADRRAFDELRLERLDRKAVKRRRAVEEDGVTLGDFREDVPDLGGLAVDHLFRRANGVAVAEFFQAANDEWLEQSESHLFRKTALTELEVGTDDDDGAAGVIDALAEKVLAETTTLTLKHIAEGFERAIACAGDGAAVAAVVKQRVNRFLEHTLLVTDNDFRSLEKKQILEAVVAVDDAAIKVVEVRGGETSAFERDERAQIRRDHGKNSLDHPLGARLRSREALGNLETLREFLFILLRLGGAELFLELDGKRGEIDLP